MHPPRMWRLRRVGPERGLRRTTLVALGLVSVLSGSGNSDGVDDSARFIRVRIVHPDGAPASGAEVGLKWRGPQGRHWAGHTTDGSGRGSVKVPHPGRYLLSVVSAPGIDGGWLHRSVYTGATHVDVGYQEQIPEITLVVPRAGSLRVELDRGTQPPPGEYGHNEIELKRYFSDRVLSSPRSVRRPKYERVEGQDNKYRLIYEGLPAGEYRVQTWSRYELTAVAADATVREGAQSVIAIAVGPPADPVELLWSGPAGPRGGVRYNINSYAGSGPPGVVHGLFDGTRASRVTRALAAGKYLLILWDLRLAMSIEVREGGGQKIPIEPPPDLLAPTGGRKLQVDVTVDEIPCAEFPVLVAPVREGPLNAGRWFRLQDTQSAGPHVLEGLQPGLYDVLLLDGGLGLRLGLASNPLVRRIELRDRDESVRFDLAGTASRGSDVVVAPAGSGREGK
jgi:hypothetical protein